jgi:uncharacterized protein YjbJ (UPF0337 family)
MMNTDILQGRWKQVRGELRKRWGALTDDDVERINGSREKLAGLLQERYGYSVKEAQQAVADFLDSVEARFAPQEPEKTGQPH